MSMTFAKALLTGCFAVGVTAGYASASSAQPGQASQQCKPPPPNFPWTYDKNCKRIPRPKVSKSDSGNAREEIRRGNCVRVKEETADGIRIVDRCD